MDLKSYLIILLASVIMMTSHLFSADDTDGKKTDPFSYQSSSYYTKGGLHLFIYGDVLYLWTFDKQVGFAPPIY